MRRSLLAHKVHGGGGPRSRRCREAPGAAQLPMRPVDNTGSPGVRGGTGGLPERDMGVFQNVRVKPLPVRAAVDIGTGGFLSLAVARVDARHGAVQKLLYHTQLPLHLQYQSPPQYHHVGDGSARSPRPSVVRDSFLLSERTCTDIMSKMRIVHGALKRDQYEGLSERAGLLSYPLCEAANALELATTLTREFKIDVRVLGRDYVLPLAAKWLAAGARDNHSGNPTDAVLMGTREQAEWLSFQAHAAASRCVAPERMLVITEEPLAVWRSGASEAVTVTGGLVRLAGADVPDHVERPWEATERCTRAATGSIVPAAAEYPPGGLVEHVLPVDVVAAHRTLIRDIQRRDYAAPDECAVVCGGDGRPQLSSLFQSPNPVLRTEWLKLRDALATSISRTLPPWVRQKSDSGGVICGTGVNGGLLNLAARVAQQDVLPLEKLEVNSEYHYCGLTDVLLGQNYPNPALLLPSTALASALLRVLETPRVHYLPNLSAAYALLIDRPMATTMRQREEQERCCGASTSLWTYDRREQVEEALQRRSWFASAQQRVFDRPHRKDQPTAAPHAALAPARHRDGTTGGDPGAVLGGPVGRY